MYRVRKFFVGFEIGLRSSDRRQYSGSHLFNLGVTSLIIRDGGVGGIHAFDLTLYNIASNNAIE
jgi:hypothetical protein